MKSFKEFLNENIVTKNGWNVIKNEINHLHFRKGDRNISLQKRGQLWFVHNLVPKMEDSTLKTFSNSDDAVNYFKDTIKKY